MNFFLPMKPPSVTAQEHKVAVKNGKPIFYDPPSVKEAKLKLTAALSKHVPSEPIKDAPIRLVTKWIFPSAKTAWLTKKPDTDNLQKMLKDCMTRLGFWSDDCLVCSEICEKFTGTPCGIYIGIEVLEPIKGGDEHDTKRD